MKKIVALLSVVALGAFALALAYAQATPGDFDPTWGEEGVVLTDFEGMDDTANTQVLMPNGKLVAAGWVNSYPGDFGLVRYLWDGSLDPSFGEGGRVVTAFSDDPELVDAPWGINVRPNGGVHLFGETCDADYEVCQFAMAAYLADGSLDESFGEGGLVTTSVQDAVTVYAWPTRNILQADGKVVAGGIALYEENESFDVDIVLIRYNPDGSLDETFGDEGISIIDFEGKSHFPQDIAALTGDKIMIVGGVTDEFEGFTYFSDVAFMARINSDGSTDSSFGGGDGYITWKYGDEPANFERTLVASESEMFIAGSAAGDCAFLRLDFDGTLDTTFGDDGWVLIDSGQVDGCSDAILTAGGQIALTGASSPEESGSRVATSPDRYHNRMSIRGAGPVGSSPTARQDEFYDHLVALYNADGTPDATFGDDGLVRFTVNDGAGDFYNLSAQLDGKLLVVGHVLVGEQYDFGVVRFLGDGLPQGATPGAFDPTWGQEGLTVSDVTEGDDYVTAHVLLDDGRYVIAGWFNNFPGDFGVGRFLANGRPDLSFGDGGWVTTAFSDDPTLVEAAWAVGARPDGGLYVVGDVCDADYDYCDLGTAAYLPDGSLDESFSDDGLTTLVLESGPTYAWPGRVIVQPDGKVVIGGVAFLEEGGSDLVLARYHPDGTLDESFGDDGVSVTDLAGMGNFMQDLMALPDGKILAMGVFGDPIDPFNSELVAGFIARFNSDGTLDTDFGSEGGFTSWDNNGAGAAAQHAVLTPDDQLLIMGHFETAERSICNLQRFDLDGIQDMTFGEDGAVIIDVGQDDECWEMDLAPDGKVVLGGPSFPLEEEEEVSAAGSAANRLQRRLERRAPGLMSRQAGTFYSFIVRYYLDGTPDDTFGDNGILRLNLFDNVESLINVVVQPDGKILTSGNNETDAVTTRFLGDGPAAQVFAPVVRGGPAGK